MRLELCETWSTPGHIKQQAKITRWRIARTNNQTWRWSVTHSAIIEEVNVPRRLRCQRFTGQVGVWAYKIAQFRTVTDRLEILDWCRGASITFTSWLALHDEIVQQFISSDEGRHWFRSLLWRIILASQPSVQEYGACNDPVNGDAPTRVAESAQETKREGLALGANF